MSFLFLNKYKLYYMHTIFDYIMEASCEHKIYGMGNTTIEEIEDFTRNAIEEILIENELEEVVNIIELYVHGSRINGNPHKDSDLDIVLYYKGNIKEDSLFNILHDTDYIDNLTYDGVYIDINPIRDVETGSLSEYIKRDKNYKKGES